MTNSPRQFSWKTLAAGCLALGTLVGVARSQLTNGEKLVTADDPEQITDAVMISSIAVAGKAVECGLFIKPPAVLQPIVPFQAGSDWLQQMTISLINRTNKTIVFGAVRLNFLDTGDCRSVPCVAEEMHFGQIPAIDAYDGRTGQPLPTDASPPAAPLNWKSEQTFVVRVSDYMPEIVERLAQSPSNLPVTAITKVRVHLGVFNFDDGMTWSVGRYGVPDPDHPGKVKQLPVNYFPGRRGHNWPPGYSQ
jgi:hypothetical protein